LVLPFQRKLNSFITVKRAKADFPFIKHFKLHRKAPGSGAIKAQVVRIACQSEEPGIEAQQQPLAVCRQFG